MIQQFCKHLNLLLLASGMTYLANPLNAQTQLGSDIDGEAAGDGCGRSISMPNANTIAIGAPFNASNGYNSGHVRILEWDGSGWVQKGLDIDGEAISDLSGISISMPDDNTIAIGAHGNDANGNLAGHARIFEWNGTIWSQKGTPILGTAAGDQAGWSVAMPTPTTVAVGSINNDDNGSDAGHARIFDWSGSAWVQRGGSIEGEAANDWAGTDIEMPDANTIAIGAQNNDGSGYRRGHVRIFEWNGSAWIQKGAAIEGKGDEDFSGSSLSMPDANTIAIGAEQNDGVGANSGHVRIFEWNGSAWTQKGSEIVGLSPYDLVGTSVSMPDANTVAVGSQGMDGNGSQSGNARIFDWDGTDWVQRGADMDGEAAGDGFGYTVFMPDANTVAVGGVYNDGSGADAGHVRVFGLPPVGIQENSFGEALIAYPNPSNGTILIDLGAHYPEAHITVRTPLGQAILRQTFVGHEPLHISIPGSAGIYMIDVAAGEKRGMVKVVKE